MIGAPTFRSDYKPCARCGRERKVHGPRKKKDGTYGKTYALCGDCMNSLTPQEREEWVND